MFFCTIYPQKKSAKFYATKEQKKLQFEGRSKLDLEAAMICGKVEEESGLDSDLDRLGKCTNFKREKEAASGNGYRNP